MTREVTDVGSLVRHWRQRRARALPRAGDRRRLGPRHRQRGAEFPVPWPHPTPGIVLTLRLRAGDDVLTFLTTTTVFGTPGDVTVAELAIEAPYPADAATRAALAATSQVTG